MKALVVNRKEFLSRPYVPSPVTDLDLAFGGRISHLMPEQNDIPAEFRNRNSHSKWQRLFTDCFFNGVHDLKFEPKEGIDPTLAWRHIRAIMGSFEPKHEHKEAACTFLMSEWFKDISWTKGSAK